MKCPKCKSGNLEKVIGTKPFNEDHLQCNKCDSTFNIDEVFKKQILIDKLLEKLVCCEIGVNESGGKPIKDSFEISLKKYTVTLEFIVEGNPEKISKEAVFESFFDILNFGK